MRGVKHHAQLAGDPSGPKGVVPRDEGTRVSGERSTTPAWQASHRHRPHRRRTLPPATAQPGAGGPTTQAEPRTRPHPEAEKSEPVARAWCRIPRRRSAQPLGQSPHPAGALPYHVRPAEASSHPTPDPPAGDSPTWCRRPGGQPTYAPRPGSSAIAKSVNQKTGTACGQSLFYLHL